LFVSLEKYCVWWVFRARKTRAQNLRLPQIHRRGEPPNRFPKSPKSRMMDRDRDEWVPRDVVIWLGMAQ
jgi:hypothetical protein